MDRAEKEKLIDELLVLMNNYLEKSGNGIKNVTFSFSEEDEDFIMFSKKHDICFDEFAAIINICLARKLIKRASSGGGEYSSLQLTEKGQDQAIASLNKNTSSSRNQGNITIETLHSNGIAQIGNGNTFNIEQTLINLIEQIDKSDATKEEKKEAKGKLKAFIEHPLINTIVGATVAAALTKAGL